jgi:hypothetical protein
LSKKRILKSVKSFEKLILATGDIIGILNSDDVFADENAVGRAVSAIVDQNVDSCYGKLFYSQI